MDMQLSTRSAAVAVLLFAAVMIPNARGQESRGTIAGVVIDASGAAIPNAKVQVTNVGTNISTAVVTNLNGIFRVPYLQPGQYSATVHQEGFKDYVRTGLELRVAGTLELQITLEVGSMNERVTVTSETPVLETAAGSRGAVIDRAQLQELHIKDGSEVE